MCVVSVVMQFESAIGWHPGARGRHLQERGAVLADELGYAYNDGLYTPDGLKDVKLKEGLANGSRFRSKGAASTCSRRRCCYRSRRRSPCR